MNEVQQLPDTRTAYAHIAGDSADAPFVLFIPGNPGVCEYYLQLMDEIGQRLPGYEIAMTSYLGYRLDTAPGTYSETAHGLDDQIAHQIKFLQRWVTSPRKVIILGHSVGAWIAQRVVMSFKGDKNAQIVFVGLLTPTVKDIAASDQGTMLTKIGKVLSSKTIAKVAFLIYYLMPSLILKKLVSYIIGAQSRTDVLQIAYKMFQRPAIAYQITELGKEEMNRIAADPEPKEIQGFWKDSSYEIWGLFSQDDHWIAPQTRHRLYDLYSGLPNVHFTTVPDGKLPHSFCLNASELAADLISEAIKQHVSYSQLVEAVNEGIVNSNQLETTWNAYDQTTPSDYSELQTQVDSQVSYYAETTPDSESFTTADGTQNHTPESQTPEPGNEPSGRADSSSPEPQEDLNNKGDVSPRKSKKGNGRRKKNRNAHK